MIKQILEKVETDGKEVRLTIVLDKEELIKEYGGIGYELKNEIQKQLVPLLVKEIMETEKENLIKKILTEVNWPEIVRSEVAQQVIKKIATNSNY